MDPRARSDETARVHPRLHETCMDCTPRGLSCDHRDHLDVLADPWMAVVVVVPNHPVTLRRWQIIAAFVLVVVSASLSTWFANHHTNARIDEAERRITDNTQSISRAKLRAIVAEEHAVLARQTAKRQHETIRVLCGEIAAIKAQIVATLRSSSGGSQQLVGRIPGYTQADADLAEARLQQALRRFHPRPCPPSKGAGG